MRENYLPLFVWNKLNELFYGKSEIKETKKSVILFVLVLVVAYPVLSGEYDYSTITLENLNADSVSAGRRSRDGVFVGTDYVSLDLLADARSDPDVDPASRASDDQVAGAMFGATLITWPVATVAAFGIGMGASFLLGAILRDYYGNPRILGAGFAIGAAAGITITYHLLPALFSEYADDEQYSGSDNPARERGWEMSGLGILGMATGTVLFILAEEGTAASTVAIGMAGISYIAAWVADIAGIIEGYQESRRPRVE